MITITSCLACDSGYKSKTGHSCNDYASNQWCTIDAQYGIGWKREYGSFHLWADKTTGKPAWACPQCGCVDERKCRQLFI